MAEPLPLAVEQLESLAQKYEHLAALAEHRWKERDSCGALAGAGLHLRRMQHHTETARQCRAAIRRLRGEG